MSASVRMVCVVRVRSRGWLVRVWNGFKIFFGCRLGAFEQVVGVAAGEALDELYLKFPSVRFVRVEPFRVGVGCWGVLVCGECVVEDGKAV